MVRLREISILALLNDTVDMSTPVSVPAVKHSEKHEMCLGFIRLLIVLYFRVIFQVLSLEGIT